MTMTNYYSPPSVLDGAEAQARNAVDCAGVDYEMWERIDRWNGVPVGLYGFHPMTCLVEFLNASYDLNTDLVKGFKKRAPDWRQLRGITDQRVTRKLYKYQQQVREWAEVLREGKDRAKIDETIQRLQKCASPRPVLLPLSQFGLPADCGGTQFATWWWHWRGRITPLDRYGFLLARLYGSELWRSLDKCPICNNYFLVHGQRRKRFCCTRCKDTAMHRAYRERLREASPAGRARVRAAAS